MSLVWRPLETTVSLLFTICSSVVLFVYSNVVPGFKTVVFNFRYSPASTEENIKSRVEKILYNHSLNYEIDWHDVSSNLFVS